MTLERILSWVLALTLASLLLAICLQALVGPAPNGLFGLIALKSGIAEMQTTGRYIVCGVQLAAVLFLLIPRTRGFGAMVGLLVSLGAIALHLSPWLGVSLPLPEQLSAAIASGATLEQIQALPTDRGGLFLLALANAILAAGALMIERIQVRGTARARRPAGAYA